MQESTSLLILWLLSSLKQERSTLCLIQMLECPAAQAEIALQQHSRVFIQLRVSRTLLRRSKPRRRHVNTGQ